MRQLRRREGILNARTPISIEREFAVFHRKEHGNAGRPLGREETRQVISTLAEELGCRVRRRTEVVEEVAPNSIEVKICLSTVAEIREDIERVYRVVGETIAKLGIIIIGISQPSTTDATTGELAQFMTMDIFKESARQLAATNSLQMHIGVETERDGIELYNIGNRIAPLLLALSQCAVIDSHDRGRARLVRGFFENLPPAFANPWTLTCMADFERMLEVARGQVGEVVNTMSLEYRTLLAQRYPAFISPDGHVLMVSPDKIFHLARLRPDKALPELGLWGSVEFRPIDGQATMQGDINLIERSLGLMSAAPEHYRRPLTRWDIGGIMATTMGIADYGLGAVCWNGLRNPEHVRDTTLRGLESIGLTPTPEMREIVPSEHIWPSELRESDPQVEGIMRDRREITIRMAHQRFMESVGVGTC